MHHLQNETLLFYSVRFVPFLVQLPLKGVSGYGTHWFQTHPLRNNRKVLIDPPNTAEWVDGAC